MHFLKNFALLGLCAVMLGTQPVLASASHPASDNVYTYSEDSSSAKNTEEDSSTEDAAESSSTETEDETETATEETTETSTEETEVSGGETTEASTEKTEDETEASTANKKEEITSSDSDKKKDTPSKEKTKDTSSSHKKSSKKEKKKTSKQELKKLDGTVISEEDSVEKEEDPETIIPKIYGTSQIVTKEDAEYMGDFIYFNQTDSAWNQNGYQIAAAGCGPASMAVVISSLTDQWVTPLDAAIWGYEHGYYSSAGSAHSMIPAMASAYGLDCKGAGSDYNAVKKALKKGKPVVALMGPGYFTRKGHFMVLIDIDKDDNVTVADVGSRQRSAYKYALSDIISQAKSAGAGGPFWIISKPKKEEKKKSKEISSPKTDYVIHIKKKKEEKQISFSLGDKVSYNGVSGIIVKFDHRKAYVLGKNGEYLRDAKENNVISLSDLKVIKQAPGAIYSAVASAAADTTAKSQK